MRRGYKPVTALTWMITLVMGGCRGNSPIWELVCQERLSSSTVDFAALPRGQMQAYLRQQLDEWEQLGRYVEQTGGAVTKYGTWSTIGKGPDADRALRSIANAAERHGQGVDGDVRTSTTPAPPASLPPPAMGPTMLYGASIGAGARRVKLPRWQTQRIADWTGDLAQLVERVASGESTQAEEREMVRRIRDRWQTVAQWLSE